MRPRSRVSVTKKKSHESAADAKRTALLVVQYFIFKYQQFRFALICCSANCGLWRAVSRAAPLPACPLLRGGVAGLGQSSALWSSPMGQNPAAKILQLLGPYYRVNPNVSRLGEKGRDGPWRCWELREGADPHLPRPSTPSTCGVGQSWQSGSSLSSPAFLPLFNLKATRPTPRLCTFFYTRSQRSSGSVCVLSFQLLEDLHS